MASAGPRWQPYAVWAAVVIPVWLVLALGCYWEPILRDSWPHLWWHEKTDISLFEFAKDTYLHNNPRIGQVIAWLLLAPGPWHVLVTPLVELALFILLAMLVLGRWPSLRRTDDALVVATLVAMVAVTCPLLGPMLFYRPYSGNYVYGLVLNLVVLVPYRLALAKDGTSAARLWLAPVMLVTGVLAGLSNEHTDPALVALVALATAIAWRRRVLRAWMVAGLVGALAGALLLFFAPGQSLRYEGLATQQSLLERIAARGADNLDIVTPLLRYLRPLALWGVLAAVCAVVARATPRRIPRITWLFAATALAITLTLLASPKQGPRLYLASVVAACAGMTVILCSQLHATWARVTAWLLAGVLAIRVGAALVGVYSTVGPEGRERLAKIRSAAPGSTVIIETYSRPRSRYFLGEDLTSESLRGYVYDNWGFARLELVGAGSASVERADD